MWIRTVRKGCCLKGDATTFSRVFREKNAGCRYVRDPKMLGSQLGFSNKGLAAADLTDDSYEGHPRAYRVYH